MIGLSGSSRAVVEHDGSEWRVLCVYVRVGLARVLSITLMMCFSREQERDWRSLT